MDKITLERIKTAHPKARPDLEKIYEEICKRLTGGRVICRFSRVFSTFAEQDEIYAQGRTKPGKIVSFARGGQSYHNFGFAADIVLLIDKDGNGTYETATWDELIDVDGDGIPEWAEIVQVFKMYGWEHGGDWNKPLRDPPHFQKTFGYRVVDLLALYNAKRVDANNFVNI
jgi:peptidoglycan LD-endopeptidase CwlK